MKRLKNFFIKIKKSISYFFKVLLGDYETSNIYKRTFKGYSYKDFSYKRDFNTYKEDGKKIKSDWNKIIKW